MRCTQRIGRIRILLLRGLVYISYVLYECLIIIAQCGAVITFDFCEICKYFRGVEGISCDEGRHDSVSQLELK